MDNKLKIYKVYSLRSYNNKNVIYYNYTTNYLHKRISAYKSRYTRYLNKMDNYIVAFEVFKLGNVYIELEEEFECINKEHINSVLNKYIRENECVNKSFYNNQEISLTDNNINQQNKLTLYKSTPFIEEIDKDIKNITTIDKAINIPDKLPDKAINIPDKLPDKAINIPDKLPDKAINIPDKLPDKAINIPDKLP
jgi:hypothetical protein